MSRAATARLIVVLTAIFSFAVVAPAAQATFPGKNGKIAFVEESYTCHGICTVAPNGSGYTGLIDSPNALAPQWSPDGRLLAYSTTDACCESHVYVSNADGSGARRLTSAPGSADQVLGWIAGGNQIAYFRFTRRPAGGSDLSVRAVGLDGTGDRLLSDANDIEPFPVFSPDGTHVAFTRDSRLYVAGADFTDARPITDSIKPFSAVPFDWSPDGSSILFSRRDYFWNCDGALFPSGDVFAISADGTSERNLTNTPCIDELGAAWSPDGRKIVLLQDTPQTAGGLSMIDADGSARTLLDMSIVSFVLNGVSWQARPEPKRIEYRNSNEFCKAEQTFWGNEFGQHYRSFGQCVSGR